MTLFEKTCYVFAIIVIALMVALIVAPGAFACDQDSGVCDPQPGGIIDHGRDDFPVDRDPQPDEDNWQPATPPEPDEPHCPADRNGRDVAAPGC